MSSAVLSAVPPTLPALPAGLDPLFAAQARFRRGDYEGCAARCSALLAQHPYDQAAWLLKCRALTAKSFLDDVDWDDGGGGIAEVLLDDHAVAQAPRPGTSLSALRPGTSAAAGGGGAAAAAARSLDAAMRPMTAAGRPVTGFARPGTSAAARPADGGGGGGGGSAAIDAAFRGARPRCVALVPALAGL